MQHFYILILLDQTNLAQHKQKWLGNCLLTSDFTQKLIWD